MRYKVHKTWIKKIQSSGERNTQNVLSQGRGEHWLKTKGSGAQSEEERPKVKYFKLCF